MKKSHDPLWEIVGEKVPLQGAESVLRLACPHCHVTLEVPSGIIRGQHFECGLCGGACEFLGDSEERLARVRSPQADR